MKTPIYISYSLPNLGGAASNTRHSPASLCDQAAGSGKNFKPRQHQLAAHTKIKLKHL